MIYTYPRPQDIYNNSVFLIAETVDSNEFTEYVIPYNFKKVIRMKKITHSFLIEAIDCGLVSRLSKPGAFNNKEYYRIPLEMQLTLF